MPQPPLASATLALGALLSTPPTPQQPIASPDAPVLFKMNCAPCHGETGDGKGWTELDRPARSFKDGGFSYGNTPEALFRSISTGIPGTPMPGFATALVEEEMRALAAHVVGLGPEQGIEDSPGKVMVVRDRPLIVRGGLPAIADGTKPRPRGLLIGTPSGMTFEYRVDDVRLLGVRQGEFVERRDWTGRGGDPLRPLGKLVHAVEGGDPMAPFTLLESEDVHGPRNGADLHARLLGTFVRDGRVGLRYSLEVDGDSYAEIEESTEPRITSVASGWTTRFAYRGAPPQSVISFRWARASAEPLELEDLELGAWRIEHHGEGYDELIGLGGRPAQGPGGTVVLSLWPDVIGSFSVTHLLLPALDAESRAKLEEELSR